MARFYRRGRKWWVDFREGGRRKRVSLQAEDLEDARTIFGLLYGGAEDEEPRGPERREEARPAKLQTLAEAARAWMKYVQVEHGGKPDTITTYRANARRWGHLPMEELDRARLQAWRNQRLGEVGRRTVRNERGIMRSFLAWCRREGVLVEVPTIVSAASRKRERPAALSDEDVATLVRAAREHPTPQVRALEAVVRVGVGTGLRRADRRALGVRDVRARPVADRGPHQVGPPPVDRRGPPRRAGSRPPRAPPHLLGPTSSRGAPTSRRCAS